MKHLKMLGLLVMAAASLMAFAGSASAATFTAPTGTEYTGVVDASLEPGTSAFLEASFAQFTCTTSTVKGDLTTNNDTHATGPTTEVTFGSPTTPCTSPQGTPTVTTLNNTGTLTINKATTEVTGTGVEVTTAVLGTSCVYGLGTGTELGTAKNTTTGAGADQVTLLVDGGTSNGGKGAKLPKISGGFLCAGTGIWNAKYIVTSPTNSFVE